MGNGEIKLAQKSTEPTALPFGPAYLFFPRMPIEALFLGNNVSATGVRKNVYTKNTDHSGEPYVFYSSFPKSTTTRAETIGDLTYYYARHSIE